MANRDLVVIGGSAGAVVPLKEILSTLPADLPAAVVIVLHPPAHSIGIFATVASSGCALPVKHADDGLAIERGTVYVARPNRHLLLIDGRLKLGMGPRENLVRPAIDPLFRSAALSYGPRAIGVILSGMLNDGASGLAAIKGCGGIALVQAPHESRESEMPPAALEASAVDLIGGAPDLAAMIQRCVNEPPGPAKLGPSGLRMEVEIAAGVRLHAETLEQISQPAGVGGQTDEHVRRLEEELRITRDRLQATIEELESTNEELKASNEEHQSVNEALQTVNDELAHRVEELARANSDLKNLLESTQIATIFLDNELRISSFTPAMSDILHLIESDIGRPIHHIAKKIAYEDLEADVRRVIRTLGTIERETLSPQTNSRYLTRILPYRSISNVIEGAVVTFLDVTQLSRAEERLRESEARLRAIVEGIPQMVWRAADGGQWTWSSPQWSEFTGQSLEASLGLGWLEVVAPEDRERVMAAWKEAELSGVLTIEHKLWNVKESAFKAVQLRATPVRSNHGKVTEWFCTATDVHELLRLQERQQVLLHELQHRVRNILAVVRSVAQRTGKTSDNVEAYSRTLEGRINAMARTHNVLTSAPEATVDLQAVIENELQSQGGSQAGRQLNVSGPQIMLSGKAAESLTMAMHELATNAVKYGALSAPNGHVSVSWEIRGESRDPRFLLTWREANVKVKPPCRRGFGSELVEHVVPYNLGGTGRLEFSTDGMLCVLDLPLSREMRVVDALETGTGHG